MFLVLLNKYSSFGSCIVVCHCVVFSNRISCFYFEQSLTAVQFSSSSLASLSLVGCRAITTLDLACPCLERICLDGCDHLEQASFSPVSLERLVD